MSDIQTVRDLINLWPTRSALAEDLSALFRDEEVLPSRVHKWSDVGAIPSKFHFGVVCCGNRRGFAVSAELVARLHSPAIKAEDAA